MRTSHHTAKHAVLVVQVVGRLVQQEELRAVAVLAAVGHGQHAAPAMLQPAVHLVLRGAGRQREEGGSERAGVLCSRLSTWSCGVV